MNKNGLLNMLGDIPTLTPVTTISLQQLEESPPLKRGSSKVGKSSCWSALTVNTHNSVLPTKITDL